MSTIIYGTTFKPIINWENITQLQFKTDWLDLLADKAKTQEWNRDRLLIAILNIIENEKLRVLIELLGNRRDTLFDMNLILKAVQIEPTTLFFEDGNFSLENHAYLEYLDNMANSTADDGKVLFHFYEAHREKFTADEHLLFSDYVTTIKDEKLKENILGFIRLNGYVSDVVTIEEPDTNELEAQLQRLEREDVLNKAALEDKQDKVEVEKEDVQPEQEQTPASGVNLLPSVVASVPSRLSIDTSNNSEESPSSSPVPVRKATPVIGPTALVAFQKVSLATRIANKWKALPTRYKLAAFGFAMLGIAATVLGIVFPPSLTVTVPLLKVSSSTLLTFGGAALTAVTLVGHAIHISRQPAKAVVLPVSETAPAQNQPQSAAVEAEQEVPETPSPSSVQNELEEKDERADFSSSAPLSVSLDPCESTRTERPRSLSASSVTILSILRAPQTTPTSASTLGRDPALPTPSSRPGSYVVPKLIRSHSMRTESSTKANIHGERIANISPRV